LLRLWSEKLFRQSFEGGSGVCHEWIILLDEKKRSMCLIAFLKLQSK